MLLVHYSQLVKRAELPTQCDTIGKIRNTNDLNGMRWMLRLRSVLLAFSLLISAGTLAAPPQFSEVGSETGPGGVWDILPDGRVLAINGNDLLMETAPGSGLYDVAGLMPAGLISPFGASFMVISPDGSRFMIGDNNFDGAFVYLVTTDDLDGSEVTPQPFVHENFQAAWMNNHQIAISYGDPQTFLGEVAVLDVDNGNDVVVVSLDGASGGIAFDENGNLLTGNGFDFAQGGSETGDIRAFSRQEIQTVLDGQAGVIDFPSAGNFVMNALSAYGLSFDENANLFIGGGRFDEGDFFTIADGAAVDDAIDGFGAVPSDARFIDDPVVDSETRYFARYNNHTGQWVVDGGDGSLYLYEQSYCLDLTLDQLTAGAVTSFTITNGMPGSQVILAFGVERGVSFADELFGYCATAGIRGITRNRTIGGFDQTFDDAGVAHFTQFIPGKTAGQSVLFQAIENGTCPDQCVSNVWVQTVE